MRRDALDPLPPCGGAGGLGDDGLGVRRSYAHGGWGGDQPEEDGVQ